MPALSLALVILAGLIHAVWNIIAKKAGGDVRFAAFTGVLLAVIWAPLGIWLGWDVLPTWGRLEWGLIVVSGLLHVLYFIALLRGYRKADLTVVYPLARGSGPLLSSMVAIGLLGEQITAFGMAGLVAVVAGVFVIAGGPGLFRAAHDPAKQDAIRMGIFYGLVTGVFIACATWIGNESTPTIISTSPSSAASCIVVVFPRRSMSTANAGRLSAPTSTTSHPSLRTASMTFAHLSNGQFLHRQVVGPGWMATHLFPGTMRCAHSTSPPQGYIAVVSPASSTPAHPA